MLNKNLIPLGIFLFAPMASVVARARVVESNTPAPARVEKNKEIPQAKTCASSPQSPQNDAREHKKHALSGALALRWLNAHDFQFDDFNNQPIKNISDKKNRDIVLDYGLMYQYRPMPSYSIGLGMDRLQVSKTLIDLRYDPAVEPKPDENTWEIIASDLNDGGDPASQAAEPFAVSNYYYPQYIANRGYNYEAILRAYLFPQSAFDPFLHFGLGFTHNRGAIHRDDGSRFIHSSDRFWTWSLGVGGSYALSPTFFIEPGLYFRDQHRFEVADEIHSYISDAIYSLKGRCETYYSLDFKIALRQTW